MTRTNHTDSYGEPLFEGDLVRVGTLKFFKIVVWDEEYRIWRMKDLNSNSGLAFYAVGKKKIKKVACSINSKPR